MVFGITIRCYIDSKVCWVSKKCFLWQPTKGVHIFTSAWKLLLSCLLEFAWKLFLPCLLESCSSMFAWKLFLSCLLESCSFPVIVEFVSAVLPRAHGSVPACRHEPQPALQPQSPPPLPRQRLGARPGRQPAGAAATGDGWPAAPHDHLTQRQQYPNNNIISLIVGVDTLKSGHLFTHNLQDTSSNQDTEWCPEVRTLLGIRTLNDALKSGHLLLSGHSQSSGHLVQSGHWMMPWSQDTSWN